MRKSEIYTEIISKIEIQINNTLFYMPGENINGIIKLYPEIKLNIKNNLLHFNLKLLQYEFWEYSNIEIEELKNIYKTEITSETIEYKIEEKESNKEEKVKFSNFSIIEFEKEEKEILIPFEFKINKNDKNLLPTFQYETEQYFLGIRHILTVECLEYNSINYTGIFIGKNKNKNFIKKKEILENYKIGNGTLEVKLSIPKQTYYFGEEVKFNFESNSHLLYKKVTQIEQNLYRKIEWKGSFKNSLLDKTNYLNNNFEYNKNEYGIFSKLSSPFIPLVTGIAGYGIGSMIGNIFGVFGLYKGLKKGFKTQYKIMREIMNANPKENEFKYDVSVNPLNPLNNEESESDKNNDNDNDIKDEMSKFVYFKDKKIIGFIKFIDNITPPVNGYYFKCQYNVKIIIHIAGVILDQDKIFKSEIDFFDGEEYIQKMKTLLSVNS